MTDPSITLQADGIRVLFHALSPDLLETLSREFLQERGWLVQQPHEWEKPRVFCERIGISWMTLSRKLKDRNCPPVEVDRGPSGRMRALAVTPLFETFCKLHLPPK